MVAVDSLTRSRSSDGDSVSDIESGCSYTRAGVFWGLAGALDRETFLTEVTEICRFMAEKRKFRSAARFH